MNTPAEEDPQASSMANMGPSDEEEEDAVVETEEVRRKSLQQLQDAVDMLPEEERAALKEAQLKTPELVQKESNPLRFLRFHSFNSWAAAKRLASYWKHRRDIFGDRAFLPLDLSEQGAMPPEDIQTFQYGAYMFLPNDSAGKTVLYIDRSKLLEDHTISSRFLFFVLQRLLDNEISTKVGAVCLINLSNPFGATFQLNNVAVARELVKKALPIRRGRIHIVCALPAAMQGRNSFVSSCKLKLGNTGHLSGGSKDYP